MPSKAFYLKAVGKNCKMAQGQEGQNEMRHPVDGEAWKDFDNTYECFADDPRSLRLAIATDGFNPFGQMTNSYSIWLVIVVPYNFPPWMCMEPLIVDMLKLWVGVSTYDAHECKDFKLHAAILWGIHDYPTLGTMSGRSMGGYFACVHYDENPGLECLRNKIGFIGHRRFLLSDHPWRENRSFNGHHENREQQRKFTANKVMARLDAVSYVPGKNPEKLKTRKQ
jgi:hypothetical protein